MGSWKGRGNQYIEFARVLYCKLPTNGKQLPAFPHKALTGIKPGLRGGRRECYHSATVAPKKKEKEGPQSISPVVIPALKCSQDPQDTDILLCDVRALQCYLDRTKDSRGGRQLLLISHELGHSKDIQCSTILSWIM